MSLSSSPFFVSPDTKRYGSFNVAIPTIWDKEKILRLYFGTQAHKYPKLAAEDFVEKFVGDYYGNHRGIFVMSIPHFINFLKVDCGINIRLTHRKSRGIKYPVIDVSWRELKVNGQKYETIRRRTNRSINEQNYIEISHKLSLELAKLRSKLGLSTLSNCVFQFEYDLKYLSKTVEKEGKMPSKEFFHPED